MAWHIGMAEVEEALKKENLDVLSSTSLDTVEDVIITNDEPKALKLRILQRCLSSMWKRGQEHLLEERMPRKPSQLRQGEMGVTVD